MRILSTIFGSIPFPSSVRGGPRGRVQGCTPPPLPEMTWGFLIQLVFCKKKKTMWFIGVEVVGHPLLKKNPGSALNVQYTDP